MASNQKSIKVNGIYKMICPKCKKPIDVKEGKIKKDLFLGIVEIHKKC